MKSHGALGVFLLGCLSATQVLACGFESQPTSDGRSQWYCANDSSAAVIFVHGLNSSNASAWSYENANENAHKAFWPELVKTDPFFKGNERGAEIPSILLASFHTGPGSGTFRIADAQKQLSDALFNSIDDQKPAIEKSTIILVGHSLGGVLLRDLLSKHAHRFSGKRVGLLLVASPTKGSHFADVAKFAGWATTMIAELKQGSEYLDDVHKKFKTAISDTGPLQHLIGREIYESEGVLETKLRCSGNTVTWVNVSCVAWKNFISPVMPKGLIVPRSSAVVYWPETARAIATTNHISIAKPHGPAHDSHQSLRSLYQAVRKTDGCVPPRNFRLAFNIKSALQRCSNTASPAQSSTMSLYQLSPQDGSPLRAALSLSYDTIAQNYRARIAEPPFPCGDDVFWAKISQNVQTSRQAKTGQCLTDVCFRRSAPKAEEKYALLNCVEGDKCKVLGESSGIAYPCRKEDRTAMMTITEPEDEPDNHWISPSFDTLAKLPPTKRPGYTEFSIQTDPLEEMPDANSFAFAVFVNDEPVRFDGLPHFFKKRPIVKGAPIYLTFPIENLGFRGGNKGDGYEDVKVLIRFYNEDEELGTATLQRRYVAYRHATVSRETDPETGVTFSWSAFYRPATSGDNFEVMLETGPTPKWMKDRRAMVDKLQKSVEGQPVVGVLRPGRKENRRLGMILGLVQDTGQVKSLFSMEKAKSLCQWIGKQAEFGPLQKQFSYIFEFPRDTFDDTRDRGRKIAFCKEV